MNAGTGVAGLFAMARLPDGLARNQGQLQAFSRLVAPEALFQRGDDGDEAALVARLHPAVMGYLKAVGAG